jgi:hypothetical protein
MLNLRGVKVTGSIGAYVRFGGQFEYQDMEFGTTTDTFWGQLSVEGGRAIATGNYRISGGGACHVRLFGTRSSLEMFGRTVTITGTPSFTANFVDVQRLAELRSFGCTFTGSVTGKRFFVNDLSIIITEGGGPNYFPCNVAGTISASDWVRQTRPVFSRARALGSAFCQSSVCRRG